MNVDAGRADGAGSACAVPASPRDTGSWRPGGVPRAGVPHPTVPAALAAVLNRPLNPALCAAIRHGTTTRRPDTHRQLAALMAPERSLRRATDARTEQGDT